MKNRIKRMIIILGCVLLCAFLNINSVVARGREEKISCYANKVTWKYKFINGVLYKRQYDEATRQWIGNWILA